MKKLLIILSLSFAIFSCDESGDSTVSPQSTNGEFNGETPTGQGGSLARFTVFGDHLYAVNWNTLNTFDISTPSSPTYVSNTQIGAGIETIIARSSDSVLFIGSQNGMHIYDVKQAENPRFISVYQHIFACDPVVANEKYAFVTLNSNANLRCGRNENQLEIVNIENLNNPFQEKVYPMDSPKGLGLDDSLLFVCDNNLKVFNAKDIFNLQTISTHNISAFDVIPAVGNYDILFVIGENGLFQYQYLNGIMELLSTIDLGS